MIQAMTSGKMSPQTVAAMAATADAPSDGNAGLANGISRRREATVDVRAGAPIAPTGDGSPAP